VKFNMFALLSRNWHAAPGQVQSEAGEELRRATQSEVIQET
jgi:hypothetical protein